MPSRIKRRSRCSEDQQQRGTQPAPFPSVGQPGGPAPQRSQGPARSPRPSAPPVLRGRAGPGTPRRRRAPRYASPGPRGGRTPPRPRRSAAHPAAPLPAPGRPLTGTAPHVAARRLALRCSPQCHRSAALRPGPAIGGGRREARARSWPPTRRPASRGRPPSPQLDGDLRPRRPAAPDPKQGTSVPASPRLSRPIGRRRALGLSSMAAPSSTVNCEDFAEFQVAALRGARCGAAGPISGGCGRLWAAALRRCGTARPRCPRRPPPSSSRPPSRPSVTLSRCTRALRPSWSRSREQAECPSAALPAGDRPWARALR